ncbi:hypothetical protein BJY16_006605 [Actinoplanes octamycinicus]|uniref:Uncharacterized protein n=1 Tax=Actinoplanes octamycinicus TaxID=135948 RepID=A0A7W7MAP8_9ACTN|nr:hypothetical protein [Actinoplanes octamycinicus]MBB4743146.1 hypothetical protein [Actinoplanes octamycinicus]
MSPADGVRQTADGWRLVFVPSLWGAAVGRFLGSLGCAGYLAAVLALFVLPAVGFIVGSAGVWQGIRVILALAALVAALFLTAMVVSDLRAVRRVDLRPRSLVLTRGWRQRELPLDTVSRIVVEERHKLGRQVGIAVVLSTGDGDIRCEADEHSPLGRSSAPRLTEWLAELLDPAEVPVTMEKVLVKAYVSVESWWTTAQVADFWDVPAEDVAGLADVWQVAHQTFLPRAAVYRSDMESFRRLVYRPDDVCEVADAIRGTRPVVDRD